MNVRCSLWHNSLYQKKAGGKTGISINTEIMGKIMEFLQRTIKQLLKIRNWIDQTYMQNNVHNITNKMKQITVNGI